MPEIVPENFSTTLLCLYFALAGRKDAGQPPVWLAPTRTGSRSWGELFTLGSEATEVWMCRNLEKTLQVLYPGVTEERYRGLAPDVWIQDGKHAIVIENKTAGGRNTRQETEYLTFLRDPRLGERERAFLYSVPQQWLSNRKEGEWWQFVREKDANDKVTRGVIAWDNEFARILSGALGVPEWFQGKLPNRVAEGVYHARGKAFWEDWET